MAPKAASLPYPPRVPLARTPTPLEPLKRMSARLGVDLYVKRDDLTGVELTGNKVRKLEFVLADALQQKADIVLTCGGAQSNHSRATAVAAARLGLRSRLILRTPDPFNPPALEGNLLLDRLAGSDIVWITPEQYKRREEIFAREADRLRRAGSKPYVIPEGASNALGAWGYRINRSLLIHGYGALAAIGIFIFGMLLRRRWGPNRSALAASLAFGAVVCFDGFNTGFSWYEVLSFVILTAPFLGLFVWIGMGEGMHAGAEKK